MASRSASVMPVSSPLMRTKQARAVFFRLRAFEEIQRRLARHVLALGRNRILEIEDDGVGAARHRLVELGAAVGGHEQERAHRPTQISYGMKNVNAIAAAANRRTKPAGKPREKASAVRGARRRNDNTTAGSAVSTSKMIVTQPAATSNPLVAGSEFEFKKIAASAAAARQSRPPMTMAAPRARMRTSAASA